MTGRTGAAVSAHRSQLPAVGPRCRMFIPHAV
jgi:hypothetical protein